MPISCTHKLAHAQYVNTTSMYVYALCTCIFQQMFTLSLFTSSEEIFVVFVMAHIASSQ